MPLPQFQEAPFSDRPASRDEGRHYIDAVHGDVAALHARIERGFADYAFAQPVHSAMAGGIESVVQSVSRMAGVVGFLGALGLVAALIF